MKISSFFKILNRKINKYDKLATNPFSKPEHIIIVWIEEQNSQFKNNTGEYENN